jgi:hypothetical protein
MHPMQLQMSPSQVVPSPVHPHLLCISAFTYHLPSAELQQDGVEFSSSPSGLNLVEGDVVYVTNNFSLYFASPHWARYFMKNNLHGVCIFT